MARLEAASKYMAWATKWVLVTFSKKRSRRSRFKRKILSSLLDNGI